MSALAVEYYKRKFGDDDRATFVHVVREVGELARAMEQGNRELAKTEITEIAGLMHHFGRLYGFSVDAEVESLYRKKLEMHKPP